MGECLSEVEPALVHRKSRHKQILAASLTCTDQNQGLEPTLLLLRTCFFGGGDGAAGALPTAAAAAADAAAAAISLLLFPLLLFGAAAAAAFASDSAFILLARSTVSLACALASELHRSFGGLVRHT